MKAVILAGGMGTRIIEESQLKPKPLVEIGGRPILWHIMKLYSFYNINDFIVCCGYKGNMIRDFFANYNLYVSDVTFDLANKKVTVHRNNIETWKVTLVDTGLKTMTGGRIKRIKGYLDEGEDFCLTYGDGVGDVNIEELISFHRSHNCLATVTAVQPPGRFGRLKIQGDKVVDFKEKERGRDYINGGFFVLSPGIFDYIEGDDTVWERDPMERMVLEGQVVAYPHKGFWHPLDTMSDKSYMEDLITSESAPWILW